MTSGRCHRFTHAIVRRPAYSVAAGLRDRDRGDPDPIAFRRQHEAYSLALESAGLEVQTLPALERFPDSVFVEDAALCVGRTAILMRPGAPSRRGEPESLRPVLESALDTVLELSCGADARVEGGDVLLTDDEALIGLSGRTNAAGLEALAAVLPELGYRVRTVDTPADVLHLKTDCGLLDPETLFATRRLAASGCFAGYRVVEAPAGEEEAANLIRVGGVVLISAGHPKTAALLTDLGYEVVPLPLDEAAKVDGGLSCLSLRYSRPADP